MALDVFSALLLVPPAPELLVEMKRTILHRFLRPHSPIKSFYTMTFWLFSLSLSRGQENFKDL